MLEFSSHRVMNDTYVFEACSILLFSICLAYQTLTSIRQYFCYRISTVSCPNGAETKQRMAPAADYLLADCFGFGFRFSDVPAIHLYVEIHYSTGSRLATEFLGGLLLLLHWIHLWICITKEIWLYNAMEF